MKQVHHLALLDLGRLLCGRFTLGQLRPDQVPVVRSEVTPRDGAFGGLLYRSRQPWCACAQPVVDVLEVPQRGSTGRSQFVPLGDIEFGQVGLEVHAPITPNGEAFVNTIRCSDELSTTNMATTAKPMDEEAKARVDRLVAWCVANKVATLEDGKTFSPRRFASLAAQAGLAGNEPYWLGILGKGNRSFAAKKARLVESALGIPQFHLDGGMASSKSSVMKITDLIEQEAELVMLYRSLSPDHKHELSVMANQLHNKENPGRSKANPYAHAPAPGAPAKSKASNKEEK